MKMHYDGMCLHCEKPASECKCSEDDYKKELHGNCPACDGTGVDGFGCMCEWCRGTGDK